LREKGSTLFVGGGGEEKKKEEEDPSMMPMPSIIAL